MKIFNTMSRMKEEFKPIEEGKIRMYVCGPTVYNFIHIGNARPMIVFDTFRRYMEYQGYKVTYVSNYTDVDDKIIKESIEEGVSCGEITKKYIAEVEKDMDAMNIEPASAHPKATEEIQGMIALIQPQRRAVLGVSMVRGSSGLAHRVLRHGSEVLRRTSRHPCRRRGPHLPAPRERDRTV